MYSAHVTEVAKKEDLFNGLEFCDGKEELKRDSTFPYYKDGVTTKSGTTNVFVNRYGVQTQCVALAEKREWCDELNDKK